MFRRWRLDLTARDFWDMIGRSAFVSLPQQLYERGLKAVVLPHLLRTGNTSAGRHRQSHKNFCFCSLVVFQEATLSDDSVPSHFVRGHVGRAWNRAGLVDKLGNFE